MALLLPCSGLNFCLSTTCAKPQIRIVTDMFRSLASSILTFIAVLLFAFVIIFLYSGSQGVKISRVAMEGDRSTPQILADIRAKQSKASEIVSTGDNNEEMDEPETNVSRGDGPPVVIWVSIPGFRGDYLEKADTPFFDLLARDGDETNKMRPNFPCLTSPAHTTLATGVPVSVHGILGDKIREGGAIVNATDPDLLNAEPIWQTATRQGIKTLVHDWPLSFNQTGDNAAAEFLASYDDSLDDVARLNRALDAWRADSGATLAREKESPAEGEDGAAMNAEVGSVDAPVTPTDSSAEKFRLVMLRLDDVKKAGMEFGPREDDTYAAISKTDTALNTFFDTVQAEWNTLAPENANLIFLVTTDHGMAERQKNVNIPHLLGDKMMANAEIVAHDAIANLFFKDLPESEAEQKVFIQKFDSELGKRIYFRTIKREEIPEEWSYVHPERTGDRILVLKTGYAFTEEKSDDPVFDPINAFAGYGYPVEESIRMSGQVLLSGFPNSPIGGGSLDEIDQLNFHATVCKMLGIEPAEGANTETLPIY